jgi:hypothetical protein
LPRCHGGSRQHELPQTATATVIITLTTISIIVTLPEHSSTTARQSIAATFAYMEQRSNATRMTSEDRRHSPRSCWSTGRVVSEGGVDMVAKAVKDVMSGGGDARMATERFWSDLSLLPAAGAVQYSTSKSRPEATWSRGNVHGRTGSWGGTDLATWAHPFLTQARASARYYVRHDYIARLCL